MRRLVEFEAPGNATLIVEVDEPERGGPRPAGVGSGAIERATIGLDQAISKVRPLADLLLAELQALSRRPDGVSVEFGIKFNAAAGIIVASTAVEGNCKVTLSWKHSG
jgi:hypothetical protein